jgi:hypothetical protein
MIWFGDGELDLGEADYSECSLRRFRAGSVHGRVGGCPTGGDMSSGPLLVVIVSLYFDFEIAFVIATPLVVFAFILLLKNTVKSHNEVKLQSFTKRCYTSLI